MAVILFLGFAGTWLFVSIGETWHVPLVSAMADTVRGGAA